MHDIKALRADPAAFDRALSRRGLGPRADELLAADSTRRTAQTQLQELQTRRNALSKSVGEGRRKGTDTAPLEAEAAALRQRMDELEGSAADWDARIVGTLETLPNTLDEDVPDGRDETANVVAHVHGTPHPPTAQPREHFELGEALGLMDFASAGRIAGARFTILRGALARLERALGQFMLDVHTQEHGYTEISPPSLVNAAALHGTGQLPKFADDLFRTTDDRWLIPTAEVPLTNLVAGEILAEETLPLRVTALTDCFRSEAGAAGRDTRGMLRQHQFRKVELVSITHPDTSADEHERMTVCAETILARLGLVYRRVLLCAGDTGFAAAKTFDLEVWLPGQQAWREVSSCSNCRAFQGRRMNARFRARDGKAVAHVHTLNGSGVAVGRALIAVMETYQQDTGAIVVPEMLRPYMGNAGLIGA